MLTGADARSPDPLLRADDALLHRVCTLRQEKFLLACQMDDAEGGRDHELQPFLPTLRLHLASATAELEEAEAQLQARQAAQQQAHASRGSAKL